MPTFVLQPLGSVSVALDGPGHAATRLVSRGNMDQTAVWIVPATTMPLVTGFPAVASVDRAATGGTVN